LARLSQQVAWFVEQSAALADWLDALPAEAFAAPSALGGWDVRTLVGHIVLVQTGLAEQLGTRSDESPTPAAEFVRRYRAAAERIGEALHRSRSERLCVCAGLIEDRRRQGAGPDRKDALAPTALVLRVDFVLKLSPEAAYCKLRRVRDQIVKVVVTDICQPRRSLNEFVHDFRSGHLTDAFGIPFSLPHHLGGCQSQSPASVVRVFAFLRKWETPSPPTHRLLKRAFGVVAC